MAQTTAYSYADVSATINGRAIRGLWDGDDSVMVEEGADVGTGLVGADGSSIWSQHVDNSARITLRLQHTSPTHRYCEQLLALQREGGLDGVPISIIDRRSGEGGVADKCYIVQAPSTSKGKSAQQRDWIFWTGSYARNISNG